MKMSCVFKELSNKLDRSQGSPVEFLQRSASMEVSASELSYLQAQVWILKNRLKEEKRSVENLTESFKEIANEKYELLQELTCQKQLYQQLHEERLREREDGEVLLNKTVCLEEEVDKNRLFLEKILKQNIELKESIMHANDTINQMGLMYLKLKEFHNH